METRQTAAPFSEGDRVTIASHPLTPYIGRHGIIKTLTVAASGEPTAWVRFTEHKGGVFVLLSELTALSQGA